MLFFMKLSSILYFFVLEDGATTVSVQECVM